MSVTNVVNQTQDEYVWIKNLDSHSSHFASANGAFALEGRGFIGSVQQVKRTLLDDPFVRRILQKRNPIIQQIDQAEAMELIDGLVDKEEIDVNHNNIMESLAEGASDNVGRYRKDLPEEAEQNGRAIRAEEIWGGQKSTSAPEKKTVKRSADSQNIPGTDGPLKVTITETVREGEWEPQTRG